MEAYSAFAKIYDKFMENIPYEQWGIFLDHIIKNHGISKPVRNAEDPLESERNLVLDMGCGTGVLTRIMYEKGYDMIGVDISQEMLDVALKQKIADMGGEDNNSEGIMYICQDMCELDLFCTVGTIYSSCDSINYLIEDEEIKATFANVANYLYPGGLFIFDINTAHKYRDVIGESTIAENAEEGSFIWDNFYDEEDNVNEYDLTLFIKTEDSPEGRELFEKSVETHYQRGFEVTEILEFIKKAGLKPVAMIDENALDNEEIDEKISRANGECVSIGVSEDSERVIFIVRKPD